MTHSEGYGCLSPAPACSPQHVATIGTRLGTWPRLPSGTAVCRAPQQLLSGETPGWRLPLCSQGHPEGWEAAPGAGPSRDNNPGVPERNSCRAFHGESVQSVRLRPPASAQQVTRLPSTGPQRHPSLLARSGITSGEEPRSRCLEALGVPQTQPGLARAGVQEGPPRPCLTPVCLHPRGGSVCVPGGWSS